MYRLIRLLADLPSNRLREVPLSAVCRAWRERKARNPESALSRPRDFAQSFTYGHARWPPIKKRKLSERRIIWSLTNANNECFRYKNCLFNLSERLTKKNWLPSWSGWIQQCWWYLCVNVTIVESTTVIYLIFKLHYHHFRALWTACTLVRLVTGSNRTSNDYK